MATSFHVIASYAAGAIPWSVTTADLGNGRQDIVVADLHGGVDVLINQGNGSFAPAVSYAAGLYPYHVATADLGSGRRDIIVADEGSSSVDVLVNQGNGSFAAGVSYVVGTYPTSVTTADLLGNGRQDIIATSVYGDVSVLINQGNGSFAAAATYAAGLNEYSVVAADLGNGSPDLVVGESGAVVVLMNQGGGSFAAAVTYAIAGSNRSVTTADLLGNGRQDIVVATQQGTVEVLMNQGNGSFAAAATYAAAAGSDPYSVTTADLGNGRPDILVADASGGLDVLMNLGGGSFAAVVTYAAGGAPLSVTTADLLGNGHTQVVVADETGTVSVLGVGPGITAATPVPVERGQTTVLGVASPAASGDTLDVTTSAGAVGTVALGAVQSDGTQQVIYTAPASIATSATDSFTYTIDDTTGGTTATSGPQQVTLDAGPAIVAATPGVVEQSQTTVIGTVTPGEAGDRLAMNQNSGSLGTLRLGAVQGDGTQQVIYTAPASVTASGTDSVAYSILDQHGVATASGTATVTLDGGPAIAGAAPAAVEQTQTAVIGTVTPGQAGDTLTLTQASGSLGTVSLGAPQPDGTQQVLYTAPGIVEATGPDTVHYAITDQHGAVTAPGSATVTLDVGPSVTPGTPGAVEAGRSTVLGTVTAGAAGDVLGVTSMSAGSVSLGPVQAGGVQQVIYTAPADIAFGTVDRVRYRVSDQHGQVVTDQTTSVTLDPGPTITAFDHGALEQGQSTIIGIAHQGAPGDVLTLSQTAGAFGTVSLGALRDDNTRQVIYTAPASVIGSGADTVGYSITDQFGGVVASSATVTLDVGPASTAATPDLIERQQTTVIGMVTPGVAGDTLTLAQAFGSRGSLSLGAAQPDGTRAVIYTAPANVVASGPDRVAYTVSDQHGDIRASGASSIMLDAGPVVSVAAPGALEQNQTTVLGTATPGLAGDTLTLTQGPGGQGTVSLGAVQGDGTQQIIYTAPASVIASGTDTIGYSVVDQHGAAIVSNTATVSLDAGAAIAASVPGVLEQNQTTVIGTVTPGLAGDSLTLTQTPGSLGTISLGAVQGDGTQQVIYTAPAGVTASGSDSVGYSIVDQHNDVLASTTASVSLDAGPVIAVVVPNSLEQTQSTVIGTVTPGVAGDSLTLTQDPGALGTVALGAVQADGTQQVIYTAPASVTASGTDTVAYSILDQHADVLASQAAAINLDGGATIATVAPLPVERNQTTVIGTVTPGEAGDTLTLTQTPGGLGTVSLGAVQADNTQQVIYTAPASVAASGADAVAYSVVDQHGVVVASNGATISLDGGPAVVAATPVVVEQGQTTVLGTVTPGLAGDVLTVTQTPGALGTVSLGAVQGDGTQQVIYTAPASVTASGPDVVSYSVGDQYNDAVATQSATVTLDAGATVSAVAAAVEQGQTAVIGIVTPGQSGDTLTLSQVPGALGTVSLGAVQADGTQQVLYTAPASVAASGTDTTSYIITDQHNAAVTTPTASVTLDGGPAIATTTPGIVEEHQTTVLGTVTPGVAGDTLSLTQAAGGLGTVTLGAVAADGTQQILYTAPDSVAANGTDSVSYAISDQHGVMVASDTASIGLDIGPSIADAVPAIVEPHQTIVIGTATPGQSGDVLTVSQGFAAIGTVSLGAVQSDGTQQILYTPPPELSASTVASVHYTIADQHGTVVAGSTVAVTIDSGPAIAARTPVAMEHGQTTVLAVVSPGEPGDTLTLGRTSTTRGTIALGAVRQDGTQQVIYTAPASVTATSTDTVAFQVTDQHGSVVSTGSADVALAVTPFTALEVSESDPTAPLTVSLSLDPAGAGSLANAGSGSIGADGGSYSVTGTAAQVNTALHGLGFASGSAGIVTPGFGVTLAGGAGATLYGNDSDKVTGSGRGLDLVGNGAGTVVTASSTGGDRLVALTGGETLDGSQAGSGDVMFGSASGGTAFKGGAGHDTVVGGGSGSTMTSGTGGSVVFLGQGANLVQSHGADTIIGGGGSDTIQAGGAGVTLFSGSGPTSFTGGNAASTVIGGSGAVTVSGGAGGGAFYGSAAGGNLLQSGSGVAFLVGAGNGDQLVATGSASDILVASAGNETLNAAGSAGNDLLYGGSGADVVSLGGGASTFLAGSGSASVSAGAGSAMFDFVAGIGGSVTISGFDAGRDKLALFGYGAGEAAGALRGASTAGGSTLLSLSDGTHITLLNVTGLTGSAIV